MIKLKDILSEAKYKETYKSITARDKDYKRIWPIGGQPFVTVRSWSETEKTGRMKTAYIEIDGDKAWVDAYKKIAFNGNGDKGDVVKFVRKNESVKNETINEDFWALPASWSSQEARLHLDSDIKKMSKILGKASHDVIKIMMDGVKGKRYDPLDIVRGIETGPWNRTHNGERHFMKMLWRKVRDGFRRYMPKGKLRK